MLCDFRPNGLSMRLGATIIASSLCASCGVLFGQNSSSFVGDDATIKPLVGHWLFNCSNGLTATIDLTIDTAGHGTTTQYQYASSDCSVVKYKMTTISSLVVTGPSQVAPQAMELTDLESDAVATPESTEGPAILKDFGYRPCSGSAFEVGDSVKACPQASDDASQTIYDVRRVHGNKMWFSLPATPLDGSTPAKRPTKLNLNFFLTKQP